jgi:hypothetical protein
MSIRSNLFATAFCLSAMSLYATTPSCRPLNSFEQGGCLRQCQMVAGYNASARVDVRGSWDIYFTGGYIFWQPREDNLELGIRNATIPLNNLSVDGRVINMNYRYKSGFKAGLGILPEWDNWDCYAEYTWFDGHQRSSANAPEGGTILPLWGHPRNDPVLAGSAINSAKGRWRLEMNIGDAQLARSYYVGTKLSFRPYFGGRAAWINQQYSAVYTTNVPITYHVHNSSHSWGLGPEAGLKAQWLMGCGFRAIGTVETDVLYTRYNLHTQQQSSSDPTIDVVSLYQRHADYLRPHTNLELGFGWGSYFNNHNYHFDIFGTYGFQVFWNQNMFRNFVDTNSSGKSFVPNGDLYIHGATGELRLDF